MIGYLLDHPHTVFALKVLVIALITLGIPLLIALYVLVGNSKRELREAEMRRQVKEERIALFKKMADFSGQ